MGNTEEVQFKLQLPAKEGELVINDRQKVAMLLDPRIKRNTQVMTRDDWTDAGEILGREYIKFYCQCKDYDRKEKQELLMLRAESAPTAGAEVTPAVVNATINAIIVVIYKPLPKQPETHFLKRRRGDDPHHNSFSGRNR
jgi:hypothetical protein